MNTNQLRTTPANSQHFGLDEKTVSVSEVSGVAWEYPIRLEIPKVYSIPASPLPSGLTSVVPFRDDEYGLLDNKGISSSSKKVDQKVQSSPADNKGHLFPLTPLPPFDYPTSVNFENSYPPNQFPDSDFPLDSFPLNSYPQMSYPTTRLPGVNFPASGFPEKSFPNSGIYPGA